VELILVPGGVNLAVGLLVGGGGSVEVRAEVVDEGLVGRRVHVVEVLVSHYDPVALGCILRPHRDR